MFILVYCFNENKREVKFFISPFSSRKRIDDVSNEAILKVQNWINYLTRKL